MFTRDDVCWLSAAAASLYSARTVGELSAAAMDALDRKFSLHSFACEEIGAALSLYRLHKVRTGSPPPDNYVAHFHDHPLGWAIGCSQTPPVLHLRGDVPYGQWQRTDHFNHLACPMGWFDQMLLIARTEPTFVHFGLHRDRVFSDDERELATLLQPHVSAAWRRVSASSSFGQSLAFAVTLSGTLRSVNLSRVQASMLRSYFPRWRETAALPSELEDWLARSLQALRVQASPRPLHAFTIESARGSLLVRCFPLAGGGAELRFVETPATPNYFRLQALGLTSRECEVLHWISLGKRDAEIGVILGAAPKTIGKHLENLLRKLSADNRARAVSVALAWLEGGR